MSTTSYPPGGTMYNYALAMYNFPPGDREKPFYDKSDKEHKSDIQDKGDPHPFGWGFAF